jgi:hypothetical protein
VRSKFVAECDEAVLGGGELIKNLISEITASEQFLILRASSKYFLPLFLTMVA